MKIAKIISTCFKRGRIREKTQLVGDPLGYFSHSQNFTTVKDTIKLLNYQLEMENKFPPGIQRDIIIVNSDVGSLEGNSYINQLNGKEINDGKIITFSRNNIGLSFGCFSDAFLKFRNDYDFFFFMEDDQITAKKDYLKIGLNKWKKTDKCGFVAFIGLTKIPKWWWKKAGLNKNNSINAYGGCGLSSTQVLNKIVKKFGFLPHHREGINHEDSIAFGEIALSKTIIDLGYKLTEIKDEILIIPAYDLMRNLKYRKYPNLLEKLIWKIKSKIFSLLSKFPTILNFYLVLLKKIKKIFK